MATSIREGLLGKENRLPHQANPAHHRASLNYPSPSPSRPTGAKSASLSDKSVSRYVRPTRSRSNVHQSTKPPAAKKPELVASSNKASFARRIYLAKNSPIVSQSPRTRQSPNSKQTGTHTSQKATSNRKANTSAKDAEQKQSLSDTSVSSCVRPRRSKQPAKPAAAKKTAAASSSNTSSFARVRSLVKNSPPASQSPSTRQSTNPKEKRMSTSSTFSGPRSSGTSQKTTTNKIVKTAPKDVKKQSLSTGPLSLKKSNNVTSKENNRSSKASSMIPTVIYRRVQCPETVNGPHPQEDDLQSTVTNEEVSTNATSSHVTSEQVPLEAISNHENPTSEVDNLDVGEGNMKAGEPEDQTPGKETNSFHLESQQLLEQLQDNNTNPINENLEVQAEDQGKEEVKDRSTGSMKKEETEVQNIPSKETSIYNLESQQLQEQLEYISTNPLNENLEVQPEDQGKEEVKDASMGSMKKEEAEVQNTPSKETRSYNLESQQMQEQHEYISTNPLNENLEVLAEDQGKEGVKDATEPIKKEVEVKEENQVGNLRETEEVKNIASPVPELERRSKPEPATSLASAPDDKQMVAGKRAILVQGKKELIAVSNDMIEETASKLQEQRKNRVKALAGAFESVISRQGK